MTNQKATLSLIRAYQDFVELVLSLPEELFLSSMNGWSPRDVVAHLIGWNGLMIEASLSILAWESPAYYNDAPNDYSNINAGFTAEHSSHLKQELLAELKSSMEDFDAFILALPAAELVTNYGVRHYSGNPATVGKIIESLTGDYQFHTHQVKEWLDTRS